MPEVLVISEASPDLGMTFQTDFLMGRFRILVQESLSKFMILWRTFSYLKDVFDTLIQSLKLKRMHVRRWGGILSPGKGD